MHRDSHLARDAPQTTRHVVIVGAGKSAFAGAYRLARQCLTQQSPGTSRNALEAQESSGGTRIACRQAAMRRAGAVLAALTLLAAASMTGAAAAQKAVGRSDAEIRIGNTMPYSGPASAYGIIGKTIAAYFDKINAEGGIKGQHDQIHFL
jgi:ABC-type branched-subunit amino acid transport system substrate-binding protein